MQSAIRQQARTQAASAAHAGPEPRVGREPAGAVAQSAASDHASPPPWQLVAHEQALGASPRMQAQRGALSQMRQSPAAAAQLQRLQALLGSRAARAPIQARFFTDDPGPGGELSKAAFLASLRAATRVVADEELAAIQQSSDDCPYLAKWFAHYQDKDADHIGRAIARFAPEALEADTLEAYIQAVVARVRQGLKDHVASGSIDAVPSELVEERHEPQDFVHIAAEGPAQRSKLCSGGEQADQTPTVDYGAIYASAEPISTIYQNVRTFVDTDSVGKIIKLCSSEEQGFFRTMSGVPGFPRCYGSDGTYAVIEFIGDFPTPAPTADASAVSSHLQQAADLCREMADRGISHNDLDNNLLLHAGQLYVIDFGAARTVPRMSALSSNRSFIERFLNSEQTNEFREI